jgi:hypothetical protein
VATLSETVAGRDFVFAGVLPVILYDDMISGGTMVHRKNRGM